MENKKEHKKKIQRSPGYPAFSLEKALGMVKILWDQDGKSGAPKRVALRHLGLTSETSGSALRTLSTLKKFGLIDEVDGRIILSQQALDLVLYSHDDEKYSNTIQYVVLNPIIYSKIYNKYDGDFPSDAALRAELIGDYNFNKDKVDGFLKDFRLSIEFADLKGKIKKTQKEEPVKEIEREPQKQPPNVFELFGGSAQKKAPELYPIPLMNNNKAVLTFERLPVGKEDLEIIKKWIDLLEKPLTNPKGGN